MNKAKDLQETRDFSLRNHGLVGHSPGEDSAADSVVMRHSVGLDSHPFPTLCPSSF
jgi:hypothetical protein